jgi:raffinose/stachyose/melibiose transport system substrate-binding protein
VSFLRRRLLRLATVSLFLIGGTERPRERVTMWFWGASPEYRAALDAALVQPFNASQNHYELHIEYRASVDNDVRVAVMGGTGPDLIYTSGPSDVTPLARAGKLAPLDAYADHYGWKQRLLAPVLDSCRQFGHLNCVPLSLEADGMFYSRALFKQRGWQPPTDGAAAERIMQQAAAAGLYPSATGNKSWQPVNENFADIFLNQYVGPAALAELLNGRGSWTSPAMMQAMTELNRWFAHGYLGGGDYFSLDFDKSLVLLHDHRAAFIFAPSILFQWAPHYFLPADGDDLAFAPFPSLSPNAPYPLYDIGVAFTYSINANSKVKDGAAAVLDRMLSPEFVLQIAKSWPGYWAPPLKSFPSDASATGIMQTYLHAMQTITMAVAQGNYGFRVGTFFPPATRNVFIRDIEAVWVGEETPQQMLAKAARRFAQEQKLGLVRTVATPHPAPPALAP